SNKMSEDEIAQKVREAERNAEEDKKFKELIEAKNHAEALIYQTEKLLEENEAVIGDLKSNILEKISDLKSAMESEDAVSIKNSTEVLQKSLHEVSSRMYGQQQGQSKGAHQGAPPGGMGGTPYEGKSQDEIEQEQFRKATGQDEGVVDAEYE
ncbi:MAG: Hsp70 family protein, partial [Promethearchaeota archaeon]